MIEAGRQIFGVGDVLEAPYEQLFSRVADEVAEFIIHEQESPFGVNMSDANGRVLEGAAEPLFALTQRSSVSCGTGSARRRSMAPVRCRDRCNDSLSKLMTVPTSRASDRSCMPTSYDDDRPCRSWRLRQRNSGHRYIEFLL